MSRHALRALAVSLLLPLTVPSTVAAESRDAPSTAETVVSTEMCSGLFVAPLVWSSVTGRKHDFLAVFDTGGSSAYIDPDSLERASGTRVETGRRVRLEGFSIAGRKFSKFRPRVRDLDHLSRALGRPLDVFLPFHAFDDFLLTLDYPNREMRIRKGSLPEPDGDEVFSSRGRDGRPWLQVRIGSRTRRVLIDSGSNGTLSINDHRGLRWTRQPVPMKVVQGMSDLELTKVGRLAGPVTLGALTLDEPIVALTRDTELIGAEVLRHFVLTFDQRNRRVRLRPTREAPVRLPSRRGTGAVLRPRTDGYEIIHIVEESPAERAGLRKGDRVTHLDGDPLSKRGCRELDATTRESRLLTVRRGSENLELRIPVEVLIP